MNEGILDNTTLIRFEKRTHLLLRPVIETFEDVNLEGVFSLSLFDIISEGGNGAAIIGCDLPHQCGGVLVSVHIE